MQVAWYCLGVHGFEATVLPCPQSGSWCLPVQQLSCVGGCSFMWLIHVLTLLTISSNVCSTLGRSPALLWAAGQ